MTVFELDVVYKSWLQVVEENDGEITPEMERTFLALEDEVTKKLENIAKLRRYAESQVETAKREEERVKTYRQKFDRLIEKANLFARVLLEQFPEKKCKVGTFAWAIQKNSVPSIKVDDLSELSPGWKKFELVEKPNNEMIAREAALGNPLPPGVTVKHGDHVRLR